MVKIINNKARIWKITFGHNFDYVHNYAHLTRWVAPYPLVNLWYHAEIPQAS